MFLDWIAQLGLLPHDPQTNILGPLPLPIRRVLISEITNYLQPAPGKGPPDPALFRSTAHVKWYMEVLGQGFCLPLEDMDITSSDISIYAQWLFQPQMRPVAIMDEALEQEFYQIIFHQCSLLFQPRITQAQAVPNPSSTSQRQQQHQQQQHQGPYPMSASTRSSSFNLSMLPINPHANHVPVNISLSNQPIAGAAATSASASAQSSTMSAGADMVSSLVQRHIELCKKTLTILAMAGRTLELSTETWTVLLKVVLGIADSLLKEPVGEWGMTGVPNMSDELCEHLLRVLFELWLRSRTRDVAMWDILKECFRRWTHRPKAIQQWSATSVSLTNRVFNLLYGPGEGSDMVILSVNGINVKLDLSPDFVYYAWHRILYLLPHPLDLPAHNFTLAMLCIGQLVDLFNNVGSQQLYQATVTAPDGNTILNMFGNYLFDACSTAPQTNASTERGCAEAFGTLCKIFCRPQRFRQFERTYIERFYASLVVGLKSDACLPIILLNSTELFVTDLEGIRMLVPDFIAAIKLVLPKLQIEVKDYVAVDALRLAAIKVVSTIMCLPKHFDKVELKPGWDWDMQCAADNASVMGEQEQIVTQLIRVLYADQAHENIERPFTCLKFYILELILMSLRTETSSYNMRYLLHLINVYVVEDVPFCPGLVGTVVKLIQEKILTMQMPSDVTLVAFDVLMDFVDLYDYVKRDSKNVARELVLALCRYVDALMAAGKLNQTYPLIVQAYDCMIKWILVSQWIVDDRDCYKAVISTLSKGIMISDRDAQASGAEAHVEKKKRRDTTFPPTKQLFQLQPRANKNTSSSSSQQQGNASRSNSTTHKNEEVAVRMAAEYAMSLFVNQLGKFPSWDVTGASAKHVEEDLDSKENIRYFMVEKRMILAIFDIDNSGGGSKEEAPAMIAIMRDTTGKYIWSFEAKYSDPRRPSLPHQKPASNPELTIATSSTTTTQARDSQQDTNDHNCAPTAVPVNVGAIPSVDDLLERGSESWEEWYFVKSLADKEHDAETVDLKAMQSEPLDRFAVAPTCPNINHEFARGFRLLLSDLGLFLPKNRVRITPLRNTDTLITEMKTLDMLNERDCISVTAYYALSGQASWSELVESSPPLSSQFLQFLNCLGWPVDIAEHTGYKGKLDRSICKTAPYYSDRNTEFLVNVPYFLQLPPADDGVWGTMDTISKIHQQVSSDDYVCVVWIEDLADYTSLAERIKNSGSPQSKAMVYIFINPLKNTADGLFWIRILVPVIGNQATSVAASQRLNESTLIFGPLVDGIVVSRHALGAMVRNTAISAHQACRVVTDTYTRPYILRRQFIEEMAHRHRSKLQLSEFCYEIFINREN